MGECVSMSTDDWYALYHVIDQRWVKEVERGIDWNRVLLSAENRCGSMQEQDPKHNIGEFGLKEFEGACPSCLVEALLDDETGAYSVYHGGSAPRESGEEDRFERARPLIKLLQRLFPKMLEQADRSD